MPEGHGSTTKTSTKRPTQHKANLAVKIQRPAERLSAAQSKDVQRRLSGNPAGHQLLLQPNGVNMVLRFNGDRWTRKAPTACLSFINRPVVWYQKLHQHHPEHPGRLEPHPENRSRRRPAAASPGTLAAGKIVRRRPAPPSRPALVERLGKTTARALQPCSLPLLRMASISRWKLHAKSGL